jgi:hypothetical protein
VKTRASGDLRKRQTLPLQVQNLAVSRWAFRQHELPELLTLSDLAGPRLAGVGQFVGSDLVQRSFLLEGSVMLASAINEPVASHLHQKGSKMSGIGESPSCVAKAAQDVGPDRLNNVHRVKLGPQWAGQLPPDCHPQIGFVSEKCALGSNHIAIVQPLDQLIQVVDAHV